MTELYKCDICGDVVDYWKIARHVTVELSAVGGIMTREHATLDGGFEETYEHTPSGPDLCKSCFNTFHAALADVLKTVFTHVVIEE